MSVLDDRLAPGSIAISRAGRERNKTFIVLRFDDTCAYLADGKLRRAAKPKKKKLIHLTVTSAKAAKTSEVLARGMLPADSLLAEEIALYDSLRKKGELSGEK